MGRQTIITKFNNLGTLKLVKKEMNNNELTDHLCHFNIILSYKSFKKLTMNPLLNRLFEDRSKSKTRRLSLQRDDHARSFDKALVPKIPTKARF